MMTTVHSNQWSSSAVLPNSRPPAENRENFLSSSSDNAPLPPSSPASAPPPASFPTPDPLADEYGDDDIDDILFDHHEPADNSSKSRGRAMSHMQPQDRSEQLMTRSEKLMLKKSATLPISLYNEPLAESNSYYNHLDPSKLYEENVTKTLIYMQYIQNRYLASYIAHA